MINKRVIVAAAVAVSMLTVGFGVNAEIDSVETAKVTEKAFVLSREETNNSVGTGTMLKETETILAPVVERTETNMNSIEQSAEVKELSHTHDWQPVYKTIHHDAVSETQTVIDQEAYDEPIYSVNRYFVTSSMFVTDPNGNCLYSGPDDECPDEISNLLNLEGYHGMSSLIVEEERYQSGTIHHDAITHEEQVVVQDAYDEQVVSGYICSCGQTNL